jgi:hypothetical protein
MKFSIRDLFLVTVIVALGLGWRVDHRRLNEAIDYLEFVIDARKGSGFQPIPHLNISRESSPNPPKG